MALSLSFPPEYASRPKEEVLKLFDEEVEKFSAFMDNVGDWRSRGALSKSEKALIKTYLVHKYRGHLDGEVNG